MNTLHQAVEAYVVMRRSLGFKLKEISKVLLGFASFLEEEQAAFITVPLALRWAQKTSSTRPAEWARRLTYIRGFARYYCATDPRTEIPPWGLLPFHPQRARPYLYTDAEVCNLLAAALRLSPDDVLRRWTYYVLFGLLAVSGMRISEVLGLRLHDVDLQNSVLTVRGTKFGQSRLVPLHPSANKELTRYRSRRDRYLLGRDASDYFFVSKRGNRLDGAEVRRTFYALSRKIGLRGPSDSHGPRLHDLRHRFAVGTLVHWYRSGEDVERRISVLSTYLGHIHVDDTYWYLTGCPELMGLAVKRLERRWREPE
jgi:integrase/recombinase XerD